MKHKYHKDAACHRDMVARSCVNSHAQEPYLLLCYPAVTPASAVHVAPLTTFAASEHKNSTISAMLFTSQNSSPPRSGSDGGIIVSMRAHIHQNGAWDVCKLTVLSHALKALHIDTPSSKSVADARSHRTSSNDIAANAFGAVERASVLRQAD
jgi:hypothetical protein